MVRVIVPSQLQKHAANDRLAEMGGALGVRLVTFDELAEEILDTHKLPISLIPERLQIRILEKVILDLELAYYRSIKSLPGFVQIAFEFIRELKAGGISPEKFLDGVQILGEPNRLVELGKIYKYYQKRLLRMGWEDSAGSVLISADVLRNHADLKLEWDNLYIDGFDDFTPAQIELIRLLADKFPGLALTLTGSDQEQPRPIIQKRFDRARDLLISTGKFQKKPLTIDQSLSLKFPGRLFESKLFSGQDSEVEFPESFLTMTAAANQTGEVRDALRWIKKGVHKKKFDLGRTAIVARSIELYRNILLSEAAEFGIPLHFVGGQPLGSNPAVAAILGALDLVGNQEEDFHWRKTVAILKSPYFRWTDAILIQDINQNIQLSKSHIHQFSMIARWGSVISGTEQWVEAFERLEKIESDSEGYPDQTSQWDDSLPRGVEAAVLRKLFEEIMELLTPPRDRMTSGDFGQWILESFIASREETGGLGLQMIDQIKFSPPEASDRDLAAVEELIFQLQAISAADQAVQRGEIDFQLFRQELLQAVESANYSPGWRQSEGVLVLDAAEARGLHFDGLAILGMAEGEFPAAVSEDPFLRDSERIALASEANLPLRVSIENADAEYFYESVLSAKHGLLLTRPRMTENGAVWPPSPFWQEIKRITGFSPDLQTSRSYPDISALCSDSEYFELKADFIRRNLNIHNFPNYKPEVWLNIIRGSQILNERSGSRKPALSENDGFLGAAGKELKEIFGPGSSWSASRLETYRKCPFMFYIKNVMELEPLEPPREGLDARQLGNLYHQIFEEVYQGSAPERSLEDFLRYLPDAAGKIFRSAPEREGFRKTAWWELTQQEIVDNIRRGLQIIESIDQDFKFYQAEQKFGIYGDPAPPLIIKGEEGDNFKVRGLIDRVDLKPSRAIRVIDYKTSSPGGFTRTALARGEKLQLPLYALAASETLDLGHVQDGFYFHARSGEISGLRLSEFEHQGYSGPEGAIKLAVKYSWEAVIGARQGKFTPLPPVTGCPQYCPAANFCWHYTPKVW